MSHSRQGNERGEPEHKLQDVDFQNLCSPLDNTVFSPEARHGWVMVLTSRKMNASNVIQNKIMPNAQISTETSHEVFHFPKG